MPQQRLDLLMVARRLVSSRELAQRLIREGSVLVNQNQIVKPGQKVESTVEISITKFPDYVSRGGMKLAAALQSFPIEIHHKVCLDIDASTGGFTDCLLQHGARKVYAIDVGINQLVDKIRNDPRVIVREKFNARSMTIHDIGEQVDIIVTDVSFISLTKILPAAFPLLKPQGNVIALIKPQFELQPHDIGAGGIVRKPALHRKAIESIHSFVTQSLHRTWRDCMASPVKGSNGNQEFLAWLQ